LFHDEIHDLCSAPHIVRVMRLADHVARRKYRYRALARKPEGKSLLGIHRCRWEDNIKEIRCEGLE